MHSEAAEESTLAIHQAPIKQEPRILPTLPAVPAGAGLAPCSLSRSSNSTGPAQSHQPGLRQAAQGFALRIQVCSHTPFAQTLPSQ